MLRIEFFPPSPLFPFSFSFSFFYLSFFSPLSALRFFDSARKRERGGFPDTMRRNWKSPDAENWPFPMIPWIYRALTRGRGFEIPKGSLYFYFGLLLLLLLLHLPPRLLSRQEITIFLVDPFLFRTDLYLDPYRILSSSMYGTSIFAF